MKELVRHPGSSSGTKFIEMGVAEFSVIPLNGIVMTVNMPLEDAINHVSNTTNALKSISQTFTNGHYGEPDHEWELLEYEKFFPANLESAALVILYYRPVNKEALRKIFSLEDESNTYDGEDY